MRLHVKLAVAFADLCPPASPAVPRDWNKVTNYCKRLGIVDKDFVRTTPSPLPTFHPTTPANQPLLPVPLPPSLAQEPNFTNSFLSWKLDAQPEDGKAKQDAIAEYQKTVSEKGGILEGIKPQLPAAVAAN